MLRIRLLGNGRVFDDSAEIKLRSREWTLPLLGYLVLHRGEAIPRRRLAFTIWPDEAEEDALERLRHNLYRLTKALPPAPKGVPWLSAAGHTLGWNNSAPFEVDVAEFERLRADEATLESGVAAYGGEFLSEFDAEWIAFERERLRRLYHGDLSALVRTNRSRRSFDRAAVYAQLLLASDPWHEECLRALISVRYESGDAAGALAEFDAFARRLRAEMNADPMPETLALRDAIARGATIPSSLGTVENATKQAPERTPFVGRAGELGKLRDRWLRAARGEGSLAFVRGEGGIGKSRLVSELALIAESEGGRVLVGTTSSPERDPYQCLASALREALPLVAGVELAPPFLAAIAELVPDLRSYRADIPHLARLDPASERARLLDALAQMFAGLARPRPLLVLLEDLHRAGTATIDAIASIVPRLVRSPVLFIGTCRPEAVDRVHPLRRLIYDPAAGSELVDLGPLKEHDVRSLVDAIDTEKRSSPEFRAALLQRSAGNPLFLTELLRDGLRTGDGDAVIPDSVKSMVSERVASLAATSKTVVEIAAVAGESFTAEMVHEVGRLPNGDVLDGLDELLDRYVIRESTGRERYEYAFTHHLIHAAIYEGIPADARLRRHRRIARILDTSASGSGADAGDERAREIAHHYERGGEATRAAIHYATAARRAAALYANDEARDLVDRSMKLDPRGDRERFELLLLRSRLNGRLGDTSADDADVQALEELAERLDSDATGSALLRRIDLAVRQANRERECEGIERLRAHAIATGSDRWLAATDEARSRRDYIDGHVDRSIEAAVASRERYERLGDDAASVRVMAFAAHAAVGNYAQMARAELLASEALRLAESAPNPETRLSALYDAAYVAAFISLEGHRAIELCRAALGISVEIGDRTAEVRCRTILGARLFDSWQIDASAMQTREALRLCESLVLSEPLCEVANNLGLVFAEVDLKQALLWLHRAGDGALERRAMRPAVVALNNLADIAWQLGDLDTMSAALDRIGPLFHGKTELAHPKAGFVQNKARLLRCRREFAASTIELEKLLATLEKIETTLGLATLKMIAEAYDDLAITQFCDRRFDAARRSLDRSVRIAEQSGKQPQYLLRRHWIDACLCRAQDRPDEARHALAAAYDIYRERLATLGDPGFRASFEEMPLNRAVRIALEHDRWPAPDSPCIVAFPGPANSPGSEVSELTAAASPR
jgi:DNA-binding SARP family transcriptional activator